MSGRRASAARRLSVVDPRITPLARTVDLFLPVKPGRDIALFNGILHLMIENDWLDHPFIERHTVGLAAVAEHGAGMDAQAHRRGDRHRRAGDPRGRRAGGALPSPAS